MALQDLLSDLFASLTFPSAHAEAPPEESQSAEPIEEENSTDEPKTNDDDTDEQGEEQDESNGGEEPEEVAEEEEEEEEEEEPQDPKPKLEEECTHTTQCLPLKHHFDACAERVAAQNENPDFKGQKEDCVEEFFHLSHCASQCAAPKLFRLLK